MIQKQLKPKTVSGKMIVRQGDVLLMPATTEEYGEFTPEEPRGLVLAEGESSGHWHTVTGRGHKLFERAGSERFLSLGGSGGAIRVLGDESRHVAIPLPPGKWLVRTQRSWTSAHESRRVAD